ncbi:MAG: hypothetical protein ABIQ06_11320 [Caldimonas sp.]
MKPAIAVIGCGGIGSRHLQALGKLAIDADVFAVDLSTEATNQAGQFFLESKKVAGSPAALHRAHDLSALPARLDVAIVATQASARLGAMSALLSGRSIGHLVLEKFLFARRHDFDAARRLLVDERMRVWVNCPRRIYPGYRAIAEQLSDSTFVSLHVSGGARSAPLGTIGIHFADLLDFLSVSDSATLKATLHSATLVPANRNLQDFGGTLEMSSSDGRSRLRYEAIAATDAPHLVSIVSDRAQFIVREREQVVQAATSAEQWRSSSMPFPVPYQSELTNLVVAELLSSGSCGLTPYARSAAVHATLFDVLIDAYRTLRNDAYIEELPFT